MAATSSTAIRSSHARLPKTLIVVGGGVIGVEYTCMFAVLGVRVILVEKRPRLLEFADQEIVEALSYHLRDSRVTMRLNEEVESVEDLADGTVVANTESKKKISAGALLYAVGRPGQCRRSQPGRRWPGGRCARPHHVDENYRTKVPNIFAAGDVIGFPRWPRFPWSRVASPPHASLAMSA